MNKSSHLKSNYIFNLIVVIIESIIPLIVTPVISRVLEPSGVGIYSYTFSLITMFTLTGALGSATHAQRKIAMCLEDKEEYSKIFYEIFFLRLIFLLISLAIFVITVFCISKYTTYFWLQIPYFIAAILDITWLYQGLEKFKNVAIKNVAFKIIGVVLIFVLVKDKNDLGLYLLILSSSQLIGNATLWISLKKQINKVKFTTLNLKRHLKEVMLYFIPTMAYQLYSIIDKVILGAFSTEDETGYYEQAQKIINLCVSFLSAYNVVIRSRMSYLFAKSDKKEIDLNISKSVQFVLLLALPISFGIISIAPNFVPWFFGDGYEKVSYLLMLFAPIIIVISFRTCLGAIVFTPFGLQSKANVAQVSAAIFNCIATFILIPWLQSYGAVISSIVSELIILVIYLFYCKKYVTVKQILILSYKYIISALIMFAGVYVIGLYIHGILATFIQIVCGVIIYFALILILRDKFIVNFIKNIFIRKKEAD